VALDPVAPAALGGVERAASAPATRLSSSIRSPRAVATPNEHVTRRPAISRSSIAARKLSAIRAARISRLPKDVCAQPYAAGLDEAGTNAILGASGDLITPRITGQVPRVVAEPPVRAYARRRAD
jgi:hypothetical protein